MTQLPFTRILLSVALASTLGLAGCDVETEGDAVHTSPLAYGENIGGIGCDVVDAITGDCALVDTPAPGFYVPGTHPRFTPAAADIPLNTDILFAGSTDGTAYIDMTADPTNPVYAAINDIDGWSTNAAFNIAFSDAINPLSVDADPLSPAQNVFVIALNTVSGGDALDPADIDPASPIDTGYTVPVTATAVSLDGGTNNILRITPTAPLDGPRKYLVIVTNGITDALADPITASASYELLGVGDAAACAASGINEALYPLCDAISGWEQLAVGYIQARNTALNSTYSLGLPTDPAVLQASLALTYTFTTTDPLTPLVGMASPRAAWFSTLTSAGMPGADAITAVNNLDAGGLIPTPQARPVAFPAPVDFTGAAGNTFDLNTLSAGALAAGVAKLYTGTIALPYYLTAAANNTDFSFLGKFWTANTSLIAALGITVPADIPDGSGNDATTNFTYRFPFAAETTSGVGVTVPLQVTLPNPAMQPAGFPATCGTIYGASGYPVVIYIHGITSDRVSVLALAHALAGGACVATVAIDLPVHGVPANSPLKDLLNVDRGLLAADPVTGLADERHFEVVSGATGLPQTMNFAAPDANLDGSGAWFINLANLQNTRDNLRQAVMDQLNLNASLGSINTADVNDDGNPDFDTTKVSVVGVSLGGIIATTFVTANELAIANDTAANTAAGATVFPIRLNPVQAMAASAAGGQLSRVLENSLSFGPRVLAGLHLGGAVPGTSDFESFMFVTQSAIDSGDPLNFAETLGVLNVPVLLQEIVGGGDASGLGTANDSTLYVADKVVPNHALNGTTINYGLGTHTSFSAPLTGTDPLAILLGVSKLAAGFTPGNQPVTGSGMWLPVTVGHHASLLRPNEDAALSPVCGEYAATAEMQTQVVSFVASLGAQVAAGAAAFTDGGTCAFTAGATAPFIQTNP